MTSLLIDASSAIILFKSGLFTALLQHYEVLCVERVYLEMTRTGYPGAITFGRMRKRGRLKVIASPEKVRSNRMAMTRRLHPGERDTVAAYWEGGAAFILTDDGKAASFCRKARIPYTCALLLPRILFCAGLISSAACSAYTDQILAVGRYSRSIIAVARDCPTPDIRFFTPAT
jgi:hypothetical protein